MEVNQVFGTLNFVQSKRFIDSLRALKSGSNDIVHISNEDFEIKEFETVPLDGFIFPKNFPNCCNYHKTSHANLIQLFNDFPNCCESHKKLLTANWFDKADYLYMPMKVLRSIAYSDDCIDRSAKKDTWFKDITDYFDYTIRSYGQFPLGFGSPFGLSYYVGAIRDQIKSSKLLSENQKSSLLDHLEEKPDDPKKSGKDLPDLESLIKTYKQWLKIFPFEISYLKPLESYFKKQMPLLQGPLTTNIYTGVAGAKLISRQRLLEYLTNTSLQIIQKINALELHKKGVLNNANETEMQLLMAKRKIEVEKLGELPKDVRKGYLNSLSKWLKGEQEFIHDLKKLLVNTFSREDFVLDILDGMRLLQQNHTNEPCLVNIREDGNDKESQFRYWFKNFLTARYRDASISVEEEMGKGKIDLKVSHGSMPSRIIEFKGWWNQDRKNTPAQIVSYLTDFEEDGFIIMINNLKGKNITEDYRALVLDSRTKMVEGSWQKHCLPETNMCYYESEHLYEINKKRITHFIFNVNF